MIIKTFSDGMTVFKDLFLMVFKGNMKVILYSLLLILVAVAVVSVGQSSLGQLIKFIVVGLGTIVFFTLISLYPFVIEANK